jgi:hypothetical protein
MSSFDFNEYLKFKDLEKGFKLVCEKCSTILNYDVDYYVLLKCKSCNKNCCMNCIEQLTIQENIQCKQCWNIKK